MDYIRPFPCSEAGNTYILHIIDYFSQYSWALTSLGAMGKDTIRELSQVFSLFSAPAAIYTDVGTHFQNNAVKTFLGKHVVLLIDSPTGISNSTGIVERANYLLRKAIVCSIKEEISQTIEKTMDQAAEWDLRL